MAKDPAQAAAKWAQNMQNSTTSITNGVNAVTTAPGELAAQQVELWAQRTAASKNRWAANVRAVSLNDWKQKMITVGIPRVASGATANQGKVQQFLTWFLPAQDAITQQTRLMPKGTVEQSIARAANQIRGTAALKRNA